MGNRLVPYIILKIAAMKQLAGFVMYWGYVAESTIQLFTSPYFWFVCLLSSLTCHTWQYMNMLMSVHVVGQLTCEFPEKPHLGSQLQVYLVRKNTPGG